ncbi:MAG TPA: hypothetical protein VEY90_00035 [Thermoleophilaceae bacterium]|jgi:hypothetical protein|nr:hypothetical protein [Thermoleophilaceae bacterium]
MKHALAALATTAAGLAAATGASAAEFSISPVKPCYGSGERVTLAGSGFTPLGSVVVSKDGDSLGTTASDATGAFSGVGLTVKLADGRQRRTYSATDTTNPTLTASTRALVSEVEVVLRPRIGAPGRRLSISATGFTTGNRLWAHVIRGRSRRHVDLGRLSGACHSLSTRRRILPRDARVGLYTVQFDAFRKYEKARGNSVGYEIDVRRGRGAIASGTGWSRLF